MLEIGKQGINLYAQLHITHIRILIVTTVISWTISCLVVEYYRVLRTYICNSSVSKVIVYERRDIRSLVKRICIAGDT